MYNLKTFITTLTALFVAAILVTGCDTLNFEEADKTYDGDNKVKFSSTEATLFAVEDEDRQFIGVSTLKPVSESNAYSFSVVTDSSRYASYFDEDETFTIAKEGEDFSLESNEVVMPANETIGELPIILNKANLSDAPVLLLEITDESVAAYNAEVLVTLRQFFPYNQQDFVGEFELVYPWWFGDASPRVVTTVAGDTENIIVVQNMLGTGTDIEFTMDDSDRTNFTVSFDKPEAWVSGTYGAARMAGSGSFDAEVYSIEASAEHTVAAGSFGSNPFTMTKITE